MPHAFLIGDIAVHDPDLYAEYAAGVLATVQAYGGRYLVRGGAPETAEGDWAAQRIVVLEFPDRERAQAWLEGPEYAPLRAKRQAASTGRFVLVDGFEG
jgi:uncharacterized protein (DUF1330 family)